MLSASRAMSGNASGSVHSPIPISSAHEIAEMRSAWCGAGSDDENSCVTRLPATLTGVDGPGTLEMATANSLRCWPTGVRRARRT